MAWISRCSSSGVCVCGEGVMVCPTSLDADPHPCRQTQGSHSDWKTWKTWKNGKAFSSQGKVREFWTDWKSQGKVRENHTKYWKTEINWDKYYLIFLVIFKWTVHFLVKWIKFSVKKTKHLKNTGKMAKNTGKVREFCQSGKVGTLRPPYADPLPVNRMTDKCKKITLPQTSFPGDNNELFF